MTDLQLELVPAPKPKPVGIVRGKELVDKWALRFGFGHYSRRVRKMSKSKQQHYFALVHFDHEEEFFEVELVPDDALPARQLEYVVIHEMTHGLVGYANQHAGAEEVICNRIARAFTRSKGPNEHQQSLHAASGAKAGDAARMKVLVDALPDQEREVVSRLFFGQASFDEVAKEIGVSKRTVGRIKKTALERMGAAIVQQVAR